MTLPRPIPGLPGRSFALLAALTCSACPPKPLPDKPGAEDTGPDDSGPKDVGSAEDIGPVEDLGPTEDAGPADSGGLSEGIWIAIPADFYPGPLWSQAIAAAPTVGILVANPSDGPGDAVDPGYVTAIDAARAACVDVLGYVHTGYGERDMAEVVAEVERYYDDYDVSGIFVDEAAYADICTEQRPYYEALASEIRSCDPGAIVALNPGTDTCEGYLDFSDILLTFESDAQDYAFHDPAGWTSGYPRERFWHPVYDVSAEEVEATVRLAAQRGAGWLYVTDDILDNPWDTLPPWFDGLVEAAASAP